MKSYPIWTGKERALGFVLYSGLTAAQYVQHFLSHLQDKRCQGVPVGCIQVSPSHVLSLRTDHLLSQSIGLCGCVCLINILLDKTDWTMSGHLMQEK